MRPTVVLLGVIMCASLTNAEVRRPAVAGAFYPGDRDRLEADVSGFLASGVAGAHPLAVIVPHAGYVFSGATAGKAFAGLAGATVTRVLLLGPSHHAGFSGGALPPAGVTAFATPLGDVPVDMPAVARLRGLPEFAGPPEAHRPEHCLEVELPFLQETVAGAAIVPILVGNGTDRETALAMARHLAPLLDPTTIVVVSSDFTHHGPAYGYAPFGRDSRVGQALLELGGKTAGRAAALDEDGFWQQVEVSGDTVCGARPISVLLSLLHHAFTGQGRVVSVTTSADVSHDFSQVVAYAAVSFTGSWAPWREDPPPPVVSNLDGNEQKAVLALARAALETHLTHDGALAHWFAEHAVTGNLSAPAGVFVTVHNTGARAAREGRLRGCIGMMEARERLVDAVIHAATAAAHDPRFRDLGADELKGVSLEVSVLSPMKEVAGPEAIVMGTHGVLLSKNGRRAVFLPQVATETGWTREEFLSQLAAKAGLPREAWRHGAAFEVFTAQVFSEDE